MLASITTGVAPAAAGDVLADAHARLLRDPSFQFSFDPPPALPPLPSWLKWIGELLGWLAPYAGWLFWGLLIVGVTAIVATIAREVLARGRPASKSKAAKRPKFLDWRPDAQKASVLLADADRLAEAGRFAEAARLLLHRSIEDIEERRPALVAIAYTSRDIAALDKLPIAARTAFGLIARHVERSLFGERAMDGAAYKECREAYADLAFPAAWTQA
jgi:hypothetical protein